MLLGARRPALLTDEKARNQTHGQGYAIIIIIIMRIVIMHVLLIIA